MIFTNLDWPNLLAGLALSAIAGAIALIFKSGYQYFKSARDLPKITGTWYSAEYDVKGRLPHDERNAFLEVNISRKLNGGVKVSTVKIIDKKKYPTSWRVEGKTTGDILMGEWKSTEKNSKRYGVAMLKFIDYGRAVGYWVGLSGYDYPVYGYWILSRDKNDLEKVANTVLIDNKFESIDVSYIVMNIDRKKFSGKEIHI
jgi:hypothetical protein